MHLSIRYGSQGMTPINHIEESIREGRVSPRGKANQGWIHNKLTNHTLINPSHNPITVDLRASNDQIIALGIIDPKARDVEVGFWSDDPAYKRYWKVEWLRVFPVPLTKEQFMQRFNIEDGLLADHFFHAHHSWASPDLNLSNVSKQDCDTWLGGALDTMVQHIMENQRYIDNHLSQAFTIQEHERMNLINAEIIAIINSANDRVCSEEIQAQWRDHVKIQEIKKKKTKKSKKKSNAKRKEQVFRRKFIKIYKEARDNGIQSDYSMASYFSRKKYTTKRGKRRWDGKVVKSLREKYIS